MGWIKVYRTRQKSEYWIFFRHALDYIDLQFVNLNKRLLDCDIKINIQILIVCYDEKPLFR